MTIQKARIEKIDRHLLGERVQDSLVIDVLILTEFETLASMRFIISADSFMMWLINMNVVIAEYAWDYIDCGRYTELELIAWLKHVLGIKDLEDQVRTLNQIIEQESKPIPF